jgi:hypothetical protein
VTKSKGIGRGRKDGSKNEATLAKEAALAAEAAARASRKGGRLRAKLEEGLTDEEILNLSPELKARLLASLQPKEPPVPAGNSFRLIVTGLPATVKCAKCETLLRVCTDTDSPDYGKATVFGVQAAPGGPISPPPTPGGRPFRCSQSIRS